MDDSQIFVTLMITGKREILNVKRIKRIEIEDEAVLCFLDSLHVLSGFQTSFERSHFFFLRLHVLSQLAEIERKRVQTSYFQNNCLTCFVSNYWENWNQKDQLQLAKLFALVTLAHKEPI